MRVVGRRARERRSKVPFDARASPRGGGRFSRRWRASAQYSWEMSLSSADRPATLAAALGFLALGPREPELRLLHRWLDSWSGIGLVVVGMAQSTAIAKADSWFLRLIVLVALVSNRSLFTFASRLFISELTTAVSRNERTPLWRGGSRSSLIRPTPTDDNTLPPPLAWRLPPSSPRCVDPVALPFVTRTFTRVRRARDGRAPNGGAHSSSRRDFKTAATSRRSTSIPVLRRLFGIPSRH